MSPQAPPPPRGPGGGRGVAPEPQCQAEALTSGCPCCRTGPCGDPWVRPAPLTCFLWLLPLTRILAVLCWEASSGMIRHLRAPCGWASGQTSPPGPEQSKGWARRDAAPEGTVLGSRVKSLSNCRVLLRPPQDICWPFPTHLTGKIDSGKHL